MAKRKIPIIENQRILLRLLEYADLPLTLSWRNQIQIRKWFLNNTEIQLESHYAWFRQYQELDTDFIFLIAAKEFGDFPIGQISLYQIDWNAKTAEFGRLIIGESKARGKGLAKEATSLLLEYGFTNLGLKGITLEVKEKNAVAIALYRATGFNEISRNNGLMVMSVHAPEQQG